jgi:hypothetical protein
MTNFNDDKRTKIDPQNMEIMARNYCVQKRKMMNETTIGREINCEGLINLLMNTH